MLFYIERVKKIGYFTCSIDSSYQRENKIYDEIIIGKPYNISNIFCAYH